MPNYQNQQNQNQVENILNAYYKNASMGTVTVNKIIPKVKDKRLKAELSRQLNYYQNQEQRITNQFHNIYIQPKQQGTFTKVIGAVSSDLHTALDSSSSSVAKLMIEGTNMGILEIVTAINHNPNIPKPIYDEGKRILNHEQTYIEKLKPYL